MEQNAKDQPINWLTMKGLGGVEGWIGSKRDSTEWASEWREGSVPEGFAPRAMIRVQGERCGGCRLG